MTFDEARNLGRQEEVHYQLRIDTKCTKWKVNGKPKVWVRSNRIHVPVKFGFYTSYNINEDNLNQWHLASSCSNAR